MIHTYVEVSHSLCKRDDAKPLFLIYPQYLSMVQLLGKGFSGSWSGFYGIFSSDSFLICTSSYLIATITSVLADGAEDNSWLLRSIRVLSAAAEEKVILFAHCQTVEQCLSIFFDFKMGG
ncbi:PREDICTED: uncharacterized protein LOC109128170 [Camelina sativa]|uniref:Uncharacterized protein LOC109128170 n=1 Tax=Camelina sativa TaxID=90675 RepID=A0ABM1QS01_CAMSA|nr:PREDICTED: uncharacterized protein LOC109128170 [Camelina sativa]